MRRSGDVGKLTRVAWQGRPQKYGRAAGYKSWQDGRGHALIAGKAPEANKPKQETVNPNNVERLFLGESYAGVKMVLASP